jgi:hypothetical protein
MYGLEQLAGPHAATPGARPAVDAIVGDVTRWRSGADFVDDPTLVVCAPGDDGDPIANILIMDGNAFIRRWVPAQRADFETEIAGDASRARGDRTIHPDLVCMDVLMRP